VGADPWQIVYRVDSMIGSEWWRSAVIYQVYPRSFADSNGDGLGDLPGITRHLPALRDLGVDAVWLSPFYTSPQNDAGYDVADYCDVDPIFGTLGDFDSLAAETHRLGLRIIVDLVPNHTSDQHAWFQAALSSPEGSPERARYLFREGKGTNGDAPPNNWESMFGGPAWSRVTRPDGSPGQWYLHLFDSSQPDLDWSNDWVREQFRDILRFWLDRGVDGFRVDVAHGLVKKEGLPDYVAPEADADVDGPVEQPPFWVQPGVHEIYREWRMLLDEYPGERVLVAEAWVNPLSELANWVRPDEMHQAFNFAYLATAWDAPAIRTVIADSLSSFGQVGAPSTWVLSNHDVVRHATRLAISSENPHGDGIGPHSKDKPNSVVGLRRARAASLLMLALPGSAYLYQGEELGLPEAMELPDSVRQDPTWFRTNHEKYGRDGCRVPIPWEATAGAFGFSPSGRSWLPQPSEWAGLARDAQEGVKGSTLELYKSALALRAEHTLGLGEVEWLSEYPTEVVAFRNKSVTVVANFGTQALPLPAGAVVLSSEPVSTEIPGETTVWLV